MAVNPPAAGGAGQQDPPVLVYCEAFHDDPQVAQNAAVAAAEAAFETLRPGVAVPQPDVAKKQGRLKKSQLNSF